MQRGCMETVACIACRSTIIYVCLPGDAILLLLEHVCILILKRAYVEFKLCRGMLELCTASELRVDGAESDTSHKFLLFSHCAPVLPLSLSLPDFLLVFSFFFLR